MKIKSTLYALGILFSLNISAQTKMYQPLDTADYAQRKTFLKEFGIRNEQLIKDLKSKHSGKTGRELEKFYKHFQTNFEKEIKAKDYSFHPEFKSHIEKILDSIKKNNPKITQNLSILISKENSPNAYCLADGTFVINMGIFNWLDNDDQIASVLSHEIAHNLLQHSLNSFIYDIKEEEKNKSTVQNLKNISVNKYQKAFDILKNNLYKEQELQRKKEIEADSLGYILFKNTPYSKNEYYNAFNNLKKYDSISPKELKLELYKKLYHLPNQPFKEKWMQKEDFGKYNYDLYKEKLDKDSLSSHPEIDQRLALLQKNFPELKTIKDVKKADNTFLKWQNIAKMEILPNLYHSEDFGLGIYTAMQLLQEKKKDNHEYYLLWLGRFFEKIYEGRKNYNLNRYLDKVEPKEQNESYQQFLNFMWNLSLKEIENISNYYNKKGAS